MTTARRPPKHSAWARLEWLSRDEYLKVWDSLEATERWSDPKYAERGIEALWDFDRDCWVAIYA